MLKPAGKTAPGTAQPVDRYIPFCAELVGLTKTLGGIESTYYCYRYYHYYDRMPSIVQPSSRPFCIVVLFRTFEYPPMPYQRRE